ncbi:hypothetical protein [Mesorhizobium comanense]|jgi:hypothetical protein|uniref:hypothetical protein n=1 Tax=Mesorhizobium comanense TaxID=2502215 RepID=UPI0014850A06|nr:hypothetical protein [Mesorhizobium comanense]
MTSDSNNETLDDVVKRLVAETGISEADALELIYLLGLNWSSLVREARVLKGQAKKD